MILQLLCCVCALSLTASSAAAAITFIRPTAAKTVPMPGFITTADFNRDGRADVAVSSPQSSEVAVLLGTAAGALTTGTTYDVGKQLSGIAAADLDADGIPDIVVADQRGSGVHVLLGAGDGTFAQPLFTAAGHSAVAVAIADLDGRNGSDLIVADRTENHVLVLLNSGHHPPSFTAAGEYAVGQGPESVLIVDVNKDERPDVVTLNTGGGRVKDVSVLLFDRIANELPVFRLLANFGVGEEPSLLTPGDFDGNGTLDLAMLNLPRGQDNGSIDLLLGQGDGFLVRGPSLAIPCPVFTNDLTCRARAFVTGDFDGDGILDLAITQVDPRATTAEDWLAIFRGAGNNTFLPGAVLSTDPVPSLAAVADVTGDGAADIVVGSDRVRTVDVFVNTSRGSTGDRVPGQTCDGDLQCLTGLCRDSVCCRTECTEDERCNLVNHLGTCTPQGAQRARGEHCEHGDQCESTFCVDQVCCVAGTCPSGARCDIPTAEGVCAVPSVVGQPCERAEHCRSEFCVDSFCCRDACLDGRCDSSGHEGTCTGSLVDGQACSANAQCTSGVCDTTVEICCAEGCGVNDQCSGDGSACEPRPTPSATPSETPVPSPSPTSVLLCPGDCDSSRTVAVRELVRGVNIALGRADLSECSAFDGDGDGRVSVNELVAAVSAALRGCNG